MQIISVSDRVGGASFNVGELKMVQLHELGFLRERWTALDDYNKFCVSVIRFSIENLVLNRIIQCSWGVIEKKFLFIKTTQFVDMATCNLQTLENKQFGFLESEFIKTIRSDPGNTVEEHVRNLIERIIPGQQYVNPAKELFRIILTRNEFRYWHFHVRQQWFIKKFHLAIPEQQQDIMINALNRTCLPIVEERKYNRAFAEFSGRLHEYVDSTLDRKVSQSG